MYTLLCIASIILFGLFTFGTTNEPIPFRAVIVLISIGQARILKRLHDIEERMKDSDQKSKSQE